MLITASNANHLLITLPSSLAIVPNNLKEFCYEYFCKFNDAKNDYFIKATRLMWNILENVDRNEINIYNRISIVKRFISLNDPSLYSADAMSIFSKEDAGQVIEEAEKSLKMYDAIGKEYNTDELLDNRDLLDDILKMFNKHGIQQELF